jgi:GT2 family glycosyltransferase
MDGGAVKKISAGAMDVKQRLAVWRVVSANRQSFDGHVIAANAAITEEVEKLRAQLQAFETSTFWRLTRAPRWLIERWRSRRSAGGVTRTPPIPSSHQVLRTYREWIIKEEPRHRASLTRSLAGGSNVQALSLGLVFLAADGPGPALAALLADCPEECKILVLERQGGTPVSLADSRVIHKTVPAEFDPADAVMLACTVLDTDFICFHDGRDRLAPGAIAAIAAVLANQPNLDLIFADEDWLTTDGQRVAPFFKPGWDPELQAGRDLIGAFAFFRTSLVRLAMPPKGAAWRYDVASQVAAATQADRIHHVPAVLCHRAVSTAPAAETLRHVAAAHLSRKGISCRVEPVAGRSGCHRVVYRLPAIEPLASIIICTRDRAGLLRACMEGVLNRTDYTRFEVIIVDNGTAEPDALQLLNALAEIAQVRVLRIPGAFNWSALNNAAAAQATGDVLVLLNNDIVVLQPDWLTELVSHAMQPGIGAVGAKLLYPDGRLQHVGLTTDQKGIPRHLFRHAPGDDEGPFGMNLVAREVWGLTGACMAIPHAAFLNVGGLNEDMPVTCNDVEMCIRLTAHGYRLVWTPWAVLEHREQASRGSDDTEDKRIKARHTIDRLIRDWGNFALHDPFRNRNLALVDEQLVLRAAP